MDRSEFATVMAYISAGCAKHISREQAEVYFDLLGDLPVNALKIAAKRSLLESQYPTFPSVGVLRKLALEAVSGHLPNTGDAWEMARKTILRFGYYREKQGMASLHPMVREAVERFGWKEMCDSENPSVLHAQFRGVYERILERQERELLMPAAVKQFAEQVRQELAHDRPAIDVKKLADGFAPPKE
jgi:hypothetical protein